MVIISRMSNYKGFLLSIDGTKWWKSQPLPADVMSFGEAVNVYGQYHVCYGELTNGTYSIFRTTDDGYSWTQTFNTYEKILCMVRPDYGIVLIGTSDGWLRSTNTGKTFTKISTQAPGCFCIKEITKDILIALDGTYIWRSVDGGFIWTMAKKQGSTTPITAITFYPTIDGTYSDLIVGCTSTNAGSLGTNKAYYGPFSRLPPGTINIPNLPKTSKDILLYSENGGASFRIIEYWRGWYWRDVITSSTLHKPILSWNNGWETQNIPDYTIINAYPRDTYNDVITDIEMTGINDIGLPQFVIQVLTSSGILKHYWVRIILETSINVTSAKFWTEWKFDSAISEKDGLHSEEFVMTGTGNVIRDVIFSGSDGIKPMFKRSIDGGNIWTTYDVQNTPIYTGPDLAQLSTIGGPFLEDSMITYTWDAPICHNGWKRFSGYDIKNQSYQMDILLKCINPTINSTSTNFDILQAKYHTSNCILNILHKKSGQKSTIYDILSQKPSSLENTYDIVNKKKFFNPLNCTIGIATINMNDINLNLLLLDIVLFKFNNSIRIKKQNSATFGMDIRLIDSHVDEILIELKKHTIQALDLVVPDLHYDPWDSRKTTPAQNR